MKQFSRRRYHELLDDYATDNDSINDSVGCMMTDEGYNMDTDDVIPCWLKVGIIQMDNGTDSFIVKYDGQQWYRLVDDIYEVIDIDSLSTHIMCSVDNRTFLEASYD